MKKQHLYEVDLMRACIILGVVFVHTFAFYNLFTSSWSTGNLALETGLTTFHYTREAFMLITGLVLFVTYYHRPFQTLQFWKKRLLLIAVPYFAWNLIYLLFEGTYLRNFNWSWPSLLQNYGMSLVTGNQFFLYYLLVSMQLYIVFPFMLYVFRRFQKAHLWILIGSFVLQLVLMQWNKVDLETLNLSTLPTWLHFIVQYRDRLVITYQFWFVAGAYMAVNYEAIKAWVTSHKKVVVSVLVVMLGVLWAHFFLDRVIYRENEDLSVLVLQPLMVPYSLAVAITLWMAGISWSKNRQRLRKTSTVIQKAAAVSFGIFLCHPLTLHFGEVAIYAWHLPTAVRYISIPFFIAFVYAGAGFIAHWIGKIPYVGYIVGQKTKFQVVERVQVPKASA